MRISVRYCIIILTINLLGLMSTLHAQRQKCIVFVGMDYRQYPIDIENAPRVGGSILGLPSDVRFWRVMSINSGAGISLKKNYSAYFTLFGRYNHFYWLQGFNESDPRSSNRKNRKNIKLDLFAEVKKKWTVNKAKEKFLFADIGIGLTNLNTKYDFCLQDTLSTGPGPVQHFIGDFLHFGPKASVGIQFKKLIIGLNAFVIEGPQRNNLTSLWLGAGIGYELPLFK